MKILSPIFILFVLLGFLGDIPLALAQETSHSLNLSSAIQMAAQKSPKSLIANERIQLSIEQLNQARSYLLPTARLNSSWDRETRNLSALGIPTSPAAPAVVGPLNIFDTRIEITQNLFDLGMIRRFQAAGIAKELSSLEAKSIQQDVMALVGILYIQTCRSKDSVELTKALLKLSQKKYSIEKSKLALGTTSKLNFLLSKTDLSVARNTYKSALTNYKKNLLDLKSALGISHDEVLILENIEQAPKKILSSANILNSSFEDQPKILAAKKNEELQSSLKKAQSADYFPTISGAANYGVNGKDIDNSEETYFYGLKASWAIFESGRREAQIAQSDSRLRESQIQSKDTQYRTKNELIIAESSLKNSRSLLVAKKDEWIYWQNNFEAISEQYKNGSISFVDYLSASVQLSRAEDDWKEALATYQSAQIQLAHALGVMQTI